MLTEPQMSPLLRVLPVSEFQVLSVELSHTKNKIKLYRYVREYDNKTVVTIGGGEGEKLACVKNTSFNVERTAF